jgi:hypothetical protein
LNRVFVVQATRLQISRRSRVACATTAETRAQAGAAKGNQVENLTWRKFCADNLCISPERRGQFLR